MTLRGPDSEILLQDGPHTRSYAEGNIVIYEINNLTNVKSVYATAQFMFVNNSNVFIARKNFSENLLLYTTSSADDREFNYNCMHHGAKIATLPTYLMFRY